MNWLMEGSPGSSEGFCGKQKHIIIESLHILHNYESPSTKQNMPHFAYICGEGLVSLQVAAMYIKDCQNILTRMLLPG